MKKNSPLSYVRIDSSTILHDWLCNFSVEVSFAQRMSLQCSNLLKNEPKSESTSKSSHSFYIAVDLKCFKSIQNSTITSSKTSDKCGVKLRIFISKQMPEWRKESVDFFSVNFRQFVFFLVALFCGREKRLSPIHFPKAFVVYLDGITFPRYSLWYYTHCHHYHFKFTLLYTCYGVVFEIELLFYISCSLVFFFSRPKCKYKGQYSTS